MYKHVYKPQPVPPQLGAEVHRAEAEADAEVAGLIEETEEDMSPISAEAAQVRPPWTLKLNPVYMSICINVLKYVYIYMYMHTYTCLSLSLSLSIYIYIYIYIRHLYVYV